MIELPALSVAALKAKLSALQDDCDYPELNDAILRDLTHMTNALKGSAALLPTGFSPASQGRGDLLCLPRSLRRLCWRHARA